MERFHGITTNTYKQLIIDSGAVYTGFTDFTSLGTLLGATRGGSQLTIEQEFKTVEVDGARGPVKGGRRLTNVKASLTVNFIVHTLSNILISMAGSSSAVFNTDWDAITRKLAIADSDYTSNVALIGQVSGNANAMGVKLDNVIVDSNFDLSLADKEEAVLPVTFTAHLDPALLESGDDTEPWTIYLPK